MKYALLFPGQGSQAVGMGKELFDSFEIVRTRMLQADAVLGRELTKVIFTGPAETLTMTGNTQPALFAVEAAITDLLAEKGIAPAVTAGHSLGEYCALYAAGVITFEDGLRLVARRGEIMAAAGMRRPGAMAAVIGLDKTRIGGVLEAVRSGIVVTANENTPEQTVISGEKAAVDEACEKLTTAGAKKVVVLAVSGAFHSPLMQEAADAMAAVLAPVVFRAPKCPVIANVTARPENDPALLKQLLVKQLLSPVRWVNSMEALAAAGCDVCVEAGPGSVLRGLARKCGGNLNVIAAGTLSNISSLLQESR
ncbi:MAG: ACP S-malonyltransferase [Chitinispirillaceae bacterium]|nr:ACP S-malonyltransferase [Chitinispirillaceae bacterium]